MRHSNDRQRGFSLVELSVSMVLSTFIIGGVIVVQRTATDGFSGSVGEQRVTQSMRAGVGEMKRELRSVLASSLVIPTGPVTVYLPNSSAGLGLFQGRRLVTFQQAVGFDVATGATSFGGGTQVGGSVEYVVDGNKLIRRVLDATGTVVPSEERVMVSNLDVSGDAGDPVTFTFDAASGYMNITVRTELHVNGQRTRRSVDTVVHLESVFSY